MSELKTFEITFYVDETRFRQLCAKNNWFMNRRACNYDDILNKLGYSLTMVDFLRIAEDVYGDQKNRKEGYSLSCIMHLIISEAGSVYFKEVEEPEKPKTLREKLRSLFKK